MKSRLTTLLDEPKSLADTPSICEHCGSPFTSSDASSKYCCTGCEYVAALIKNENLDHFYDLKDAPISPVQSRAFEIRNYDWLSELQKNTQADIRQIVSMELAIEGISCFGCVWLIEKLFEKQKGAGEIRIYPATGTLHVKVHQNDFDPIAFAHGIQKFGYILAPRNKKTSLETHRLRKRLGLCAAFALNNMLFTIPFYVGMSHRSEFANLFQLLVALLATLSMVVGGSYFIQRAVHGLRLGTLHMDLPISIGICAAYLGSLVGLLANLSSLLYFDFVSIFIFLMLLGRWIQEVNVEKNQHRLLKMSPHPDKVRRCENPETESFELIPIEQIARGSILEIPAGEIIPVSGTLLTHHATLNMSWINGESEPRDLKQGQTVFSGATHIGKTSIRIQTLESWNESLLHRLIQQNAPTSSGNQLLHHTLKYYILSVIVVATMAGLFWWLDKQQPLLALQVFISLLVVSCPCALGLSYPFINEVSVLSLQKVGLFIKNQDLWGKLRGIRKIIFDKTGTLTLETPILQNAEALLNLSDNDQRALLRMTSSSFHPVSQSLREALLRIHPQWSALEMESTEASIEEIPGQGLKMITKNESWMLGKPAISSSLLSNSCEFRHHNGLLAAFSFHDALKSDAKEEISQLRRLGFDIFILSGDTQSKLTSILERLGLSSHSGESEMTPDQKALWITEHTAQDALMIGDGVNDSLAFDKARCTGTPVIRQNLLEQKSDFYFAGNNLKGIRKLFEISKIRKSALIWVFIFAVAYNIFAGFLCIMGWMNPLAATVFMPLSSVLSLTLSSFFMRKAALLT